MERPHLLVDDVLRGYFADWSDLGEEKQTEFAWGIYSWTGNSESGRRVEILFRDYTLGTARQLFRKLELRSGTGTHGRGKLVPIHQYHFARHPGLLAKTWQLLYVLRIQTVTGIDLREELLSYYGVAAFQECLDRLEADSEALAMLVAGVNYVYLVRLLLLGGEVDSQKLVAKCLPQYDSDDLMHLKLRSYLYSHIVINESRFFNRPVLGGVRDDLLAIMNEADRFVKANLVNLSLDNKFEHLACMKYMGLASRVADEIWAEAAVSVGANGRYYVDRWNANPNKYPPSLRSASHTMMFYIMARSEPRFATVH